MGVETQNAPGTQLAETTRLRRGLVFVVLLALISISCVCSTENLPSFITDLVGGDSQQDTLPAGNILLQDDFNDPDSGWEVEQFDSGSVGYANGKYFVISTESAAAMWGAAGRNYSDVVIEVEATQVRAPSNSNNDYGVMCRLKFTGEGYSFNISGDGFYSIQKMVDNEFSDLVEWTESSAIRKGNATNNLRIVCDGTKLALSVNGELLAEVNDNSFTSGDIALAATTYEMDATEIHFDNLIVREP
jgi:hypothetical protein